MKRNLISRSALVLCLAAMPLLAIADHHKMDRDDDDRGAQHQRDRNYDPVQRAEKHLKGLEQALNLTAEQQSAWQAYSNAVMEQARDKAARMDEFRDKRGEMRDMDTASRLEWMSQRLRERADQIGEMANDTRAFQKALTAEQQTTFDQFWMKHYRRGKGRHRSS